MISWLFFGKERAFTNCNLIILTEKEKPEPEWFR